MILKALQETTFTTEFWGHACKSEELLPLTEHLIM